MKAATATRRLQRTDKARRLAYGGHVHPSGTPGCYWVDSESADIRYWVELHADGTTFCQCIDWRRQREQTGLGLCKHEMAATLYRAAMKAAWRPRTEAA